VSSRASSSDFILKLMAQRLNYRGWHLHHYHKQRSQLAGLDARLAGPAVITAEYCTVLRKQHDSLSLNIGFYLGIIKF
jgi:hypothetical protein